MEYLNELEQAVKPIYQQIIEHPFNQELAAGTLSEDRFRFYVSQDVHYIGEYSRALAALAAKAPDHSLLLEFIAFAKEGLEIERELHQQFIEQFRIQQAQNIALSTEAYANFLLTTAAYKSFPEALAALLPCFSLYNQVAVHIYRIAQQPNKYQRWIDTYSGAEFDQTTRRLQELLQELAGENTPATRESMKNLFIRSAQYEWFFWDSAYHLRYW